MGGGGGCEWLRPTKTPIILGRHLTNRCRGQTGRSFGRGVGVGADYGSVQPPVYDRAGDRQQSGGRGGEGKGKEGDNRGRGRRWGSGTMKRRGGRRQRRNGGRGGGEQLLLQNFVRPCTNGLRA